MYIDSEKMERRYPRKAEIRVDIDGTAPKITGYASVFNQWADIGGLFKERVKKGAFAKTIKEADIRALWNHNENYVLGRNKSGSLKLREDDTGLAVEIDPIPAQWADDLLKSMRRGDVNQMSFGFMVNKQDIDYERDERTLIDVSLFDVSVVTYPAYPTTTAQVRSMFQNKEQELTEDEPTEADIWADLDSLVDKLKRGELTEEELRALKTYLPDLSPPPEKHDETPSVPPEKHTQDDARSSDRWHKLYVKAEKYIKSS